MPIKAGNFAAAQALSTKVQGEVQMLAEPGVARVVWVVVADGARGQVYERAGAGPLSPVEGMAFSADLPPTHDLVEDRQGRSFESVGHMRHGLEPRQDPHEARKEAFLNRIVTALDERLGHGSAPFDALILVAPPPALGVLRGLLPDRLADKVTAEIAKDLTKHPLPELAKIIGIFN